jgi:phosphate-selective porin OprO and OprP
MVKLQPALWIGVATFLWWDPSPAHGEDLDAADPSEELAPKGYQWDHEYISVRFGGGFLFDYNGYDQDNDNEAQMNLEPEIGIRDLRALVSGRLGSGDRVSYTLGYMYDAANNEFRFRQTGLRVLIPELNGHLFLGRTKEGFSTNKFMVGYYGWTNERSAANDAFLPILADGARWTGTAFGNRIVYNIGAFDDRLSDSEAFNKNDWQFAGRLVFVPLGTDTEDDGVLHLAVEGRYADSNDGFLQYKSKPESFLAQSQVVDTGMFEASRSSMLGLEAYYVRGPFSSGSEYFLNKVSSDREGDPFFHGGEAFIGYLFTGETHPYKPHSAVFEDVTPRKTLFDEGGWGAWELVLRASYVDLDSEAIAGGRFFRGSSVLNWYVTPAMRLEAIYGYGVLDRMDMVGGIHFFQTRVQLQFK